MGKERLSWRISEARGTIKRLFLIGGVGRGTRSPADDPVGVLLGGLLIGAENCEQIGKHLLGSEVEIDTGRFRGKGDENLRVVQPEAKRPLLGTRLVARQQQLIG